jgi:hypothetical protein
MNNTLMGLVLKTNGDMFFGQVPKGLQNIYAAIGCDCIEGVRLKDAIMYIDEEGKFKPEPKMNKIASILAWSNGLSLQDWIAGDAVLFGTVSPEGEYDGEDYDLPPHYSAIFQRFTELSPNAINFMVEMFRESMV